MARPRIFDETRKQINIYLHNEQYAWLQQEARRQDKSPSAIMRSFIDQARGEPDKIGPKGTTKIIQENL